jgi:hypothetical protein
MALVTANVIVGGNGVGSVGFGIIIVVEGDEVVGDDGVGVEEGKPGISGATGVLDGLEVTMVIHPDIPAIAIIKVITKKMIGQLENFISCLR